MWRCVVFTVMLVVLSGCVTGPMLDIEKVESGLWWDDPRFIEPLKVAGEVKPLTDEYGIVRCRRLSDNRLSRGEKPYYTKLEYDLQPGDRVRVIPVMVKVYENNKWVEDPGFLVRPDQNEDK